MVFAGFTQINWPERLEVKAVLSPVSEAVEFSFYPIPIMGTTFSQPENSKMRKQERTSTDVKVKKPSGKNKPCLPE